MQYWGLHIDPPVSVMGLCGGAVLDGGKEKMTYKLIGTKPNETADEAIIRCASNLVKAVLASGRSIHATPGMSCFDIEFFDHRPGEIDVSSCLSHWRVCGRTPLKITFAQKEPENDLTQDDAEMEAEHGN